MFGARGASLGGFRTIGAYSSATKGSGIPLSATNTAVWRMYADDNGAAMTGSLRAFLVRTLLTVDHPGDLSIRSIMGQIKFKDLADLTNGVSSAIEGYLELGGTNNFGANALVAGLQGIVEVTTATTITAGGHLAGLASIYKSAASPTGDCVGIIVRNHPLTAGKFAKGLYIKASGATMGIQVGDFASTAAGSGIVLSAAATAANRVYADDGGAKLAAGEKRVSLSRFLFATSDTDATDQTMSAEVGQIKVANDLTIGGNLAGICGYLEVLAAKTLIGGRYAQASVASGVWGRVDVPATGFIGTAAYVSAFAASGNLGGTHTGKASVMHIPNPQAGTWDFFASFGSATGCTVANALVPAAAPDATTMGADLAIKIDLNGTAYYIPAYDTLHA